MKELLKSLYIFGVKRRDNYYPILEDQAFEEWYEQNKSKIDNILEEQKVKTSDVMINLFEIMIRNQSDMNWKQSLLEKLSKLKSK